MKMDFSAQIEQQETFQKRCKFWCQMYLDMSLIMQFKVPQTLICDIPEDKPIPCRRICIMLPRSPFLTTTMQISDGFWIESREQKEG